MRRIHPFLAFPTLVALGITARAQAATYYVAPEGTWTSGCTTRETSCDLASGAALAMPGDTVVLLDGVYKKGLYVPNSGTANAWITFQADECSTPIIEGPGVGPTEDNQDSGVFSDKAQYIKFIGIVSRGWSTGFGNGWTGNQVQDSNGNWQIEYCLADGNGRTGFTFYSASNFSLKHSISAHNGSSTAHSWSSGVTLYSTLNASVEANVSFENMDAENFTDGSGFIADEGSHDASFVNNIAFRNAGSCLRLTHSHGTKFINNTCYHDAQDTRDTGPTNPSELYFTADSDNSTTTGTTFANNVLVNTGTGPGMDAVINQPSSGWSNNVVKTGNVNIFTAPETNYTLTSSATDLIGKGTGSGAPANDIGFDPKCLKAGAPTLVGNIAKGSWWQVSVDIDYIKSLGGVQKCFNPKARSGTPDVGAYANGAVTTQPTGTCTPPVVVLTPPPASGGMGGMPGTAGSGVAAGSDAGGAVSAGGMPAAGGMMPAAGSGVVAGGMTSTSGGMTSTTGGATAVGGTPAMGTGGSGGTQSMPGAGTSPTGTGGSSMSTGAGGSAPGGGQAGSSSGKEDSSGCGCRVGAEPRGASLAAFGLAGLALFGLRRRRRFR